MKVIQMVSGPLMCNTNWAHFGTDQGKAKWLPEDPPVGPDMLPLAAPWRISGELAPEIHLPVIILTAHYSSDDRNPRREPF